MRKYTYFPILCASTLLYCWMVCRFMRQRLKLTWLGNLWLTLPLCKVHLWMKFLMVHSFLTGAMKVLQEELVATTVPPESSEAYRLSLSCSLFYKVYLMCVCVRACVCMCMCIHAYMPCMLKCSDRKCIFCFSFIWLAFLATSVIKWNQLLFHMWGQYLNPTSLMTLSSQSILWLNQWPSWLLNYKCVC